MKWKVMVNYIGSKTNLDIKANLEEDAFKVMAHNTLKIRFLTDKTKLIKHS